MAGSRSLFRNNRDWRGLSLRLDPAALPTTIDLVPPRWGFWLLVAIGLGWMVFAFNGILGDVELDLSLMTLAGLLFPAIGLAPLGYGLMALTERRAATFGRDGVEVVGRSLAGPEAWSLRYGAYRGVLHRTHVVRGRNRSTTYQIIELLHKDPEKTLPLSVEAASEIPRDLWESYARALGLRALEHSGGELVGRAAADLDKSIRTLAAEGKVAHRFDPDAPPPSGISVAREAGKDQIGGERLRITISAGRVPQWALALFAVPAAIACVASLLVAESLAIAAFTAVFVLIPLLVFRFDRRKPRQIVITRNAVALIDPWQGTSAKGKSLKLDEIESVTIQGSGRAGRLVIAGDRARLRLGAGLARPALDWLKDYLTAAVTTA